jgi:hypothetical protein
MMRDVMFKVLNDRFESRRSNGLSLRADCSTSNSISRHLACLRSTASSVGQTATMK